MPVVCELNEEFLVFNEYLILFNHIYVLVLRAIGRSIQ